MPTILDFLDGPEPRPSGGSSGATPPPRRGPSGAPAPAVQIPGLFGVSQPPPQPGSLAAILSAISSGGMANPATQGLMRRGLNLEQTQQKPQTPGGAAGFIGGVLGGIDDFTGGTLFKALDVIDTPRSAIASTFQELGDLAQGEGFNWDEWKQQTTDNIGFGTVFDDWGLQDQNIWLRRAAGFMGDVFLDPVTYIPIAGLGAKAAKSASATKIFTMAGRQTDDVARQFLINAGDTVLKKGGMALQPNDVRRLHALTILDDADLVARATRSGTLTMDDLSRIAADGVATARQTSRLTSTVPAGFRAGARLNLPGTGRVVQRTQGALNRLPGVNMSPVRQRSIGLAPTLEAQQFIQRNLTPSGLLQRATNRFGSGKVSNSTVRRLLGGDYQELKQLIDTADPTDTYRAYMAIGSGHYGRATAHGWAIGNQEAFVETMQSIPKDKWRHVLPAMEGSVDDIAALGPESMQRLSDFRDGWLESANKAVGDMGDGGTFLKRQENWAPHTWSQDMIRYVNDMSDSKAKALGFGDLKEEIAGQAKRSLDPKVKAANIKVGGEFMGEVIEPISAGKGTPRQQANKIFRDKVSEVDHASFSGIFSDDPIESILSNIQYTQTQIAKQTTINKLVEAGVAVDMAETWRLAEQAERAKLHRMQKVVDSFLYRADPNLEARTADAQQAFEEARAALDEAIAAGASRTEQAKRLEALADQRVAKIYKAYRDGLDGVDEMLAVLEGDVANKVQRIDRLQNRLRNTIGRVNKTITKSQRRQGELRTQIADLFERAERAMARGDAAGARAARTAHKELDKLYKQLDEVTADLATLKGYAQGRFNDATGAQAAAVLDQLDNRTIPTARAKLDDLRDGADRMIDYDGNGQLISRREAVARASKELQGAEDTANLLRQEVAVHRTLLGDTTDMDWTEWYRLMLDDGSETLDEVFGVATAAEARRVLEDPMSVRADFLAANGLVDETADTQIAAILRATDAELTADDIAMKIEQMKRYANAPEHVDGKLINWRNPDAEWGYGAYLGTLPENDMRNFYGPALTSRVDPTPGSVSRFRPRVHTSQTKTTGLRYSVKSVNPMTYMGDVRHVNLDAVEAAILDGIPMHRSWGPEWKATVAPRVAAGESLRDVLLDVFPGKDPLTVVDDLLQTPGRVSATARRKISRSLRHRATANGHDSLTWMEGGEWVVVPLDRRNLSLMDNMPETMGEVMVRSEEQRAMRLAETAQAKQRVVSELGADLDYLRGVEPDLVGLDARLDRLRRELNDELDEAIAQRNPMKEQATREARERLDDALRYRDAADQHLERIEQMVAQNVDEATVNVERSLHEVANLERAAAEARASHARWLGGDTTQKNLAAAQRQVEQIKKNLDAESWQKTIDAGMKQVSSGSSTFLPEQIAEGLQAVSKMNYQDSLKHMDAFMRSWKALATTSPGFHIRNYLGGVLNNLAYGINPSRYGQWGQMERIWLDAQKGTKTQGGGLLSIPGVRTGVGSASYEDVFRKTRELAEARGMDSKLIDAYLQIRRSGIADGGQFDELGLNRALGVAATQGRRLKAFNPLSSENLVSRGSARLGGRVEQRLRGSLALDVMLGGGGIDEAMSVVHKYHFNYDDLSTFERTALRRVVPFYTWTRKNLPLQLEMLIERPVAFQRYMALQRNLEVGTEEQAIVPHYFNRLTSIRVGSLFGSDDTAYLNPSTPFSNMTEMLTPDGILNSTAPWFKIPYQLQTGQDSFTGQPYADTWVGVPRSWEKVLGPPLEAIGAAQRNAEGELVMPLAWFDNLRDASPVLSNLSRFPGVGSPDRSEDRKWSSFISWMFGVGSTVNTPKRQGAELYRVASEWDSEATRARELMGEDSEEYEYARTQAAFYREKARELYQYEDAREAGEPVGPAPTLSGAASRSLVPAVGGTPPPLFGSSTAAPGGNLAAPGGTLGQTPPGATSVPLPTNLQEDDVTWDYSNGLITVSWPGGSQTILAPQGVAEDGIQYDFRRDPLTGQLMAAFSERPYGSY